MMKKNIFLYIGLMTCLLAGCTEADEELVGGGDATPDNLIRIGGIGTDGLVAQVMTTRADGDTSGESDDGDGEEENVQRANAEDIAWLRDPLFSGLDITYGKEGNPRTNSRVAILTLLKDASGTNGIKWSDGNLAEYSFLYRDDSNGSPTDVKAIWHDNGTHFFEGLFVPTEIKYRNEAVNVYEPQITNTLPAQTVADVYGSNGSAPLLTTDQHDDNTTAGSLGNYTLLTRYLGMPPGFTLNATVARVKLPFRHRLARVLAYILIDPDMGNDVTINGYSLSDGEDDPTTTDIRFCNVDVLAGVKDSYDQTTQHHTYTPQWNVVRKAIPHFVGERGSYDDSTPTNPIKNADHFIAYYNAKKKAYVYPTDAEWTTLGKSFSTITSESPAKETATIDGVEYERTIYGKVPVYDLIVRPTYSLRSRVMYDEEGANNATTKDALLNNENKIDFEITLSNGLQYDKEFVFDLDANYQTVVYLHISRERVDYKSSGSELWLETIGYEDYYGVNNQNGNTLSFAGSGWQRAYTNVENTDYNITDGHLYQRDDEDEYAQYVGRDRWIEMFTQACEGGKHHGDYFILEQDISIPAAAFPDNFVFTGHLDGLDHTITLTNADYTKVTHQAYDSYEAYDSHGDIRYIKLSDNSYQIFTPEAGTTYYQKVNKGTVDAPVYEYSEITDWDAIQDGTEIYTKVETSYESIAFFKKVHHDEVTETVPGKVPTSLFAGLNGNYTTAQEGDMSAVWEANVHKEKWGNTTYWVPFKADSDGWRAEVINVNINGGTLFKAEAAYSSDGGDGTHDVTGHVHNCWEGATYDRATHKWSGGKKVKENIPSIPEY